MSSCMASIPQPADSFAKMFYYVRIISHRENGRENGLMAKTMIVSILILVYFLVPQAHGEETRGGLVMAFDDGYPSWNTIIAPELHKAGGTATGFVNNQRIHAGHLRFSDLRDLQNRYGWEIGTHTYHHFHAPDFIKRKGVEAWTKEELDASLNELATEGLKVQSLAFPFNDSNETVEKTVMKKARNFRRYRMFPMFDYKVRDGSYPAAPFEIGNYVPIELVIQWIDFARQQNRFVFLYGHKVLPDEEFITGEVASVSGNNISFGKTTGSVKKDVELCIAPDSRRRIVGPPIRVLSIENEAVAVSRSDMQNLTKAGATFIIGECYGIQVSYFRKLINYAAGKVPFYTVSQALEKVYSSQR
ncbi:MAG: Polysaccharide deacetylase [Syntrophorhabdus sp. PtaU1.Bin002]|nr:MAG: Polysaccharide deacetylase [Syntrophorhabdus sp. PtaB.Bin006]OPY68761.1 MAG: Polysaccharide deacetylase [Syntrophorhabdus sp. PtaU1.Bin002]